MNEAATDEPEGSVRVLVVDDDEDDFFLTRDYLADIGGHQFVVEWETDFQAALNAIGRDAFNVYLIDYRLGASSGLDLIQQAHVLNSAAPLILLTGQGEREIDFAVMRAGAADYLEKGTLSSTLLERSIRYSIQKKQSEEQLEKRVLERTTELAQTNAMLQREIRDRQRADEALREVDRRKDEFLAVLAHELRNPLAPIRNALEILRLSAHKPQAIERGRQMMERQVAHMIHLIDDLLDISRITRGKVHLRTEAVELDSIVTNAVEGSQSQIEAGQHELTISLPKPPVIFEADPLRVTQILINLLTNAAKYTEAKGRIFLVGRLDANYVEIRVRDTGIGIPTETLPTIFEMFAQADRSRERAQGGLGIGLALVRGLVVLHGGTVEAFSEGVGKGSEFVIRLPVQPMAA